MKVYLLPHLKKWLLLFLLMGITGAYGTAWAQQKPTSKSKRVEKTHPPPPPPLGAPVVIVDMELVQLTEQVLDLKRQGRFDEAIPLAIRALQLREKSLGREHPEVADSLNDLALLYQQKGNYTQAEALYQRALQLLEKTLGAQHPNVIAVLNNLVGLYQAKREGAKAELFYQRVLQRAEKSLGANHIELVTSLVALARLYYANGDYGKSEPLFLRALKISEKSRGAEHNVAMLLNDLALLYKAKGHYIKARPLLLRSLQIVEKTLGAEHLDFATALQNLADFHFDRGAFMQAEPLLHRALKIREKALGPDHPEVAYSLNSLALLYQDKDDFRQAESLWQRALKIKERELGLEHPEVATLLLHLGDLYQMKGDYTQAEFLVQRALEIDEKTLGIEHPDTALSLNALARLYWAKGNYGQAESLFQRVLQAQIRGLGAEHPAVANSLSDLAMLYLEKGDYLQVEALLQQSLKINEKALGAGHPATALLLNKFAQFYFRKGNYTQAELFYQQALQIREKALGADHSDVALSLNDLAMLYSTQGNSARAELLLQRALPILEKTFGMEHPELAKSLINLAGIYLGKGDFAQATPLLQRGIQIQEKLRGGEHPDLAKSLSLLALLYGAKGDYLQAERIYQKGLHIQEKAWGTDHPDIAETLNALGQLYQAQNDYAKAELLMQRVLKINEKALGLEHPTTALSLNNLAFLYQSNNDYVKAEPRLQQALMIAEKTLGPEHPQVTISLINLADLYRMQGKHNQALPLMTRATEGQERYLTRNLVIGSERQKQLFLGTLANYLYYNVSLHIRYLPQDRTATQLALTSILQRKGRTLDATTEQSRNLRRLGTSADIVLFDQLLNLRSQQSVLELDESNRIPLEQRHARLQQLNTEAERLENTINQRSAALRTALHPISLPAIQHLLPAEAALVEFFVYYPFNGIAKLTGQWSAPRYVVYVLRRDGSIRFAELGDAAAIEQAVNEWRAALQNRSRGDVKALARKLDTLVMQPVRALVGDAQHLLLSPDGALNLIPFAALVDEQDRFLLERFRLSYLTSGRDLLRLQATSDSKQAPLVLADPDFNAQAINNTLTKTAQRALAGFTATPLPGTAAEATAIKKLLPQATVLTGAKATKAALKQATAPRILHIATHGFFLAAPASAPPPALTRTFSFGERSVMPRANTDNPLLRSGLALAGFNQPGAGDGVLTALEATGMDLWGTKLVVLSACETGVGEVKNGEGVYGLRRAFVLAGAETQVMSLWQVDDKATQELMTAYYQRLLAGEGRAEALRQVQIQMLKNTSSTTSEQRGVKANADNKAGFAGRSHPYYWASFIQSGEWANLDGKREESKK